MNVAHCLEVLQKVFNETYGEYEFNNIFLPYSRVFIDGNDGERLSIYSKALKNETFDEVFNAEIERYDKYESNDEDGFYDVVLIVDVPLERFILVDEKNDLYLGENDEIVNVESMAKIFKEEEALAKKEMLGNGWTIEKKYFD